MSVEDEFESLVAAYAAAARGLGYRKLQRRIMRVEEERNLWSCCDYYFDDDATFLDLNASIARGDVPKKYLLGFNGVQFYTFIQSGDAEDWVISNGSPEPPPAPLMMRPFLPLIHWVEKLVPEYMQSLRMNDAADLPRVLDRHRQALAARGGVQRKPDARKPLEQRWKWSESFKE